MTVKELRKYLRWLPGKDTVYLDTEKAMYLEHIDEVEIRKRNTNLTSYVSLRSYGENGTG